MVRSKFTSEQKIRIVLESFRTSISTTELCRRHNVHPHTFRDWREKFLESGKEGLRGGKDGARAAHREMENLKRIIGELAIANDILKKPWRKAEVRVYLPRLKSILWHEFTHVRGRQVNPYRQRLRAPQQIHGKMSLSAALGHAGVSRCMWHCVPRPRDVRPDPATVEAVQGIGSRRPTYGTRRMAAQVARETSTPTNRKQIQRIFRRLGWTGPQKTKNDIIRSGSRPARPEAPNRLWETDMTYVWCGNDGWCYCFNMTGCFTRKWISYAFDVRAGRDAAICSVTEAVASERPDCPRLRLRTDNGTQYASRDFRAAVSALGIRHESVWRNTPEQNGHVESFHKTLKKEYLWPHEFATCQEAEKVLADAFADYNTQRIHSAIGYLTPAEFAAQWEMKNK